MVKKLHENFSAGTFFFRFRQIPRKKRENPAKVSS
jgi:hypothetical protein